MKEVLNYIKHAYNKNNLIDVYRFVAFKDGYVQTNNGIFAVSCKAPVDAEVYPLGSDVFDALKNCKGTTSMTLNANGDFIISDNSFTAQIKCTVKIFPRIVPQGQIIEYNCDLASDLKPLLPFFVEDNDHLWTNGVCLNGWSARTTDNIVFIDKKISTYFPWQLNVPLHTIKALCAIDRKVVAISFSNGRLTLFFDETTWLNTSVILQDWPDTNSIFEEVPETFSFSDSAVDAIAKLSKRKGVVYLNPGKITLDNFTYTVPDKHIKGCYDIEKLHSFVSMGMAYGVDVAKMRMVGRKQDTLGVLMGVRVA